MCEIDEDVINVSKKFFGHVTATSFDDPRVNLVIDDAAKYVQMRPSSFDVIIVDSSDPVGPAETLFTSEFYTSLRQSLRGGGIICNQGECQWLHHELIGKVLAECGTSFATVEYAFTTIPTYPCGQIGFLLCSLAKGPNFLREPVRSDPALVDQLRYYSPEVHQAAFVLPRFTEKLVGPLRKNVSPLLGSALPTRSSRRAALLVSLASACCGAVLGFRAASR